VKKLLVVALSVVMVLAFAAFAMAATETFTGNVNAEYNTVDAINNGYGDVWAEIAYDKDFTEGWTGGLKFRVKPANTVAYEGDGFIKYTADMWNVNFATGGSFGAGVDLNAPDAAVILTKYDVDGVTVLWVGGGLGGKIEGPNVAVNVTPMEGFTGTLWLTDTGAVTEQTFDIGVKGVYDANGLNAGLGYAMSSAGTSESTDDATTMALFGSYKLMEDALKVGLEYQSRAFEGIDDPAVGMKVYANYSKDALSAGISYITRTAMFYTKDDKWGENWALADRFMDVSIIAPGIYGGQNEAFDSLTDTRYLISANVSYKLTDAITAGLNVDMTDAKYNGVNSAGDAQTDVSMGYKVYVTDQIVPDLSVEAGYQAFLDSKVYVTLKAKL